MEDDGDFDFSQEDRIARQYKKYLQDIIRTTRALLINVKNQHRAICKNKQTCTDDFNRLVQNLENEVRQWQNFAVTWKIQKDDVPYKQTLQRFKDLFAALKSERNTKYEQYETMIDDCLKNAAPLLRLYDSHRTLLSAEQQHVPFDTSVSQDYWELERLAQQHMWGERL